MGFSLNKTIPDVINEYLSVKSAAKYSGYNPQYLRRLLRNNIFRSKRIGQLWLIDRDSFIEYLEKAKQSKDNRFGPH